MEGKVLHVNKLSEKDREWMKRIYTEEEGDLVRIGPKGYLLNEHFMEHASKIYNMQFRHTDVFVASFPRSGTTWTQELVWLLANNLDFETAKSIPMTVRFAFLEFYKYDASIKKAFQRRHPQEELELPPPAPVALPQMSDPRFIKTHLPMSLLPETILDTVKMVFVARDPRDVLISYYHFYMDVQFMGMSCDLKQYFDTFLKHLVPWAPYWDHLTEAWSLRNHPNMLFLFYEELSKDLKACAKKVSKFLNKGYTDEQLDKLCEYLQFNNFQKVIGGHITDDNIIKQGVKNFVRKGKSGGWREEFDSEMTARACAWMRENMRKRNLDLPWTLE